MERHDWHSRISKSARAMRCDTVRSSEVSGRKSECISKKMPDRLGTGVGWVDCGKRDKLERWKSHWPITMEGRRDKKAKVCHERDESAARSLPQSSLNHLVHKMPSSNQRWCNMMTRWQCFSRDGGRLRELRRNVINLSSMYEKANK